MQMFVTGSEYDRTLVYANLEKWWKRSPMYKKKRLITTLAKVSQGTPLAAKLDKKRTFSDLSDMDLQMEVIRV